MKKITVTLKGLTPYMADALSMREKQEIVDRAKGKPVPKNRTFITAEERMNVDGNGNPIIYAEHVRKCIINAAKSFKSSGIRSRKKDMAGGIRCIEPDEIVVKFTEKELMPHLIKKYNGETVAKENYLLHDWSISFAILAEDNIDVDLVKGVLDFAGLVEGLGGWRPGNRSPGKFGKFTIDNMKVV